MAEEKAAQIVTGSVSEIRCRGCKTVLDVSGLEAFTRVSCPNCGAEKVVPATLGNYILLERIGTGGMGAVYRGKDPMLDREVAIKVLLASMGSDPKALENFNHEAKAAARLNHPNVAQIYAFGQEQGQPYIVMEFIRGKSLKELIVPDKYLDESFVMKTGLDITAGLRAASGIGLLHGDIKPENILFSDSMEAKLIDFGLATFANQEAAEGIWGSPYYIAPEKVQQQDVNERSDIYSLGGTLYHALCGKPPFQGETAEEVVKKRLKLDPRSVADRRRDISETVEQIVTRMLKRSPGERYPNYKSLASDLQGAVDELGKSAARRARHSKSARIYSDVIPTQGGATGRRRTVTGSHRTATNRPSTQRGRSVKQSSRDWGTAGRRTTRSSGSSRDLSRHTPSKSRAGERKQSPPKKSRKGLVMAGVVGGAVLVAAVGIALSQKGGGARGRPGGGNWNTGGRGVQPGPGALLFSENFGSGKADKFTAKSGYFMVQKGRYHGLANKEGEWIIGLVKLSDQLPPQVRIRASAKTRESRTMKNAYIIFDYISPQNYKFAGMQDDGDKWVVGIMTDKGERIAESSEAPIDTGKDYKLEVFLTGATAKLIVDGVEKMSYQFDGGRVTDGQVGVGSKDGHSSFDDIVISQ